jgi:hypothetical protein
MSSDTFLIIGFGIVILLFAVMLVVGLPRGKRMQATNERIEINQRRILETAELQAVAAERIAAALEARLRD